jgi:hypothetical protein
LIEENVTLLWNAHDQPNKLFMPLQSRAMSTLKKCLFIWFAALVVIISPRGVLHAQESVKRVYTERRAGYDKTVVMTDETVPNSCVLTYFQHEIHYTDINYLVKLAPSLTIDGDTIVPSQARDLSVDDFPGGVIARFKMKNVQVETTIMPLMIGRKTNSWEGAVLYEINTAPRANIVVNIGSGETLTFDRKEVQADSVAPLSNSVSIDEHTIQFRSGEENIPVIIKSSGAIKIQPAGSDARKNVSIAMESGSGQILIGFANKESQLSKIVATDFSAAKAQVNRYYARLLASSQVETPDTNMNNAFRSAIYNLEYTWIKPYGWLECLHHWYALFQQQVTDGADWIGQTNRSKLCILEQAHYLIEGGNVPQFMPDGVIKRDFGGSNQYWAWQIMKYIQFTGDKAFAREIIPYLDQVIAKIIQQHDRDGDMLFSWGLQIGNQEDFIGNPGDATNPSIEMVNMLRTRAELSELIGDKKGAKLYREKADEVLQQLHDKLWLKDLGRFAYFKDLTGNVRLDGQYETYLYPIIWNIVDPLDQYTGLRHLLDRLTRSDDTVFCSDNFSWHSIGTWGMQDCEAQQPWAAWGFSKFGLNNLTWRPLKAMADWAMDKNHRGAWPEMSVEPTPGYFTPPAGLYIAATVEALFGLNMDAPKNALVISPSFPDSWPGAKLTLPDFKVDYHRNGHTLTYALETGNPLKKEVQWRLPACRIIECLVNGQKVNYSIQPYVQHVILRFNAGSKKTTKILIKYDPLRYHISYPHSVAEGDTLRLKASGFLIDRVADRCGVLGSWTYGNHQKSITAVIRKGLVEPYLKFGRLGQLDFSRRTFFVHGRLSKNLSLWFPVDLTILPRFEAASLGEVKKSSNGFSVRLQIRNNTETNYNGPAVLQVHGKEIQFAAHVKARSEIDRDLSLPQDLLNTLSPGDNEASLFLESSRVIPITLTAEKIIKYLPPCQLVDLPLPKSELIPAAQWNTLRVMPGFPHIFFTFSNYGWPKPMLALDNTNMISVPEIPGLIFKIPHREFIPVSHKSGKVSFMLDLKSGVYKKIYLLILPFVDNHDMFTKAARVTVYSDNQIIYTRTLYYPGDLDYWVPNVNPTAFATFRKPRPDRFGLLPLLKPGQSDWAEGRPPLFPEPDYWSTSIPVVTKSCLMDVIEMDLNTPMKLDSLVFESIGDYNAFGIVGAVGETVENK